MTQLGALQLGDDRLGLSRRQLLAGTAGALAWPLGAMAQSATSLVGLAGLRLPIVRGSQQVSPAAPWSGVTTLGVTDFRGQWVYLDFWASWCTPCRLSFPWMNSLQDRFAPRGLHIVAVGLDKKAERMEAFLKATQPRFWILWDEASAWAERLQIQSMPSSALIRPDGVIMGWHRGFTQAASQQIEAQLSQFLPEKKA